MPSLWLVIYGLTRFIRFLFSVASLLALGLLALVFIFQFLPHPKKLTPRPPWQYHIMITLESSTYAVLEPLEKAIPTRYTYKPSQKGKGVNLVVELSPLIAFFALLGFRFFLRTGLRRFQEYADERSRLRAFAGSERGEPLRSKLTPAGGQDSLKAKRQEHIFEGEGTVFSSEQKEGGTKAKVSMRLTLLDEISRAKRMLETTKRYLAFLSVDVVKSTQMKEGEDEVAIGSSFMAYKRFVESKLAKHGVWKQSWTPDGLMAAFENIGQAVAAGQEILSRLEEFNKNHNQLKTPFHLRLGAHGGELYFDSSDNIEEVGDQVIDVAGHLQKEADVNTLWITQADIEMLGEKGRFRQIGKKVEAYTVFEWSVAGNIGDYLRMDGLISKEQLEEAIKEQERSSRLLGQILVERGFLGEEDLLQVLGKQLKAATLKVEPSKVETEVLRLLPKELAERLMIFPLSFREGVLEIVSDSLIEAPLLRKLEASLGLKISQEAIAGSNNIRQAIEQGYRRLATDRVR